MIIYDLFPLLAGPFTKWEQHFDHAADMAFDWIFINPIQKTGVSGSLYSVSDYFDFNPLLVDPDSPLSAEDQVKGMLKAAKKRGLRVMIDLVINHCAADSALIKEHPEWFAWEGDHVAHPFCIEGGDRKTVWDDLAKFNHEHTSDREGLFKFLMKIVSHLISLGFEGFRCDAAYQLPHDIWTRLIRETKAKHPEVCFLAETLGCTPDQTSDTARAGFDYVFNSSKWWDFNSNWLMEQYNLIRETSPSISFPESHDTPRLCEELGGNINGLKQRYLFSALFSAGVMVPIGFEYGFRKKLHVVETRPDDWEADTGIDLRDFIREVNTIKKTYKIFQEDSPTHFLPSSNGNIMVMWKASTRTREEMLLILNKDIWNNNTYYCDNMRDLIQAGAALTDISPGERMEYLPRPFHYDLLPGQGLVLITSR
ncbi:MAG: alpha-amylase [Spartobacteria bacterium]|nr:alpha-amylase [Spartobacteria bacterium]